MAVVLYKKGRSANIRGIRCDFQIFEPNSMKQLLEVGWFLSPEEVAEAEAKEKEIEEEKAAKEEKQIMKKATQGNSVAKEKPSLVEKLKVKKAKLKE